MPPVVAAIGTAISTIGGLTIGKIAIGKFILQAGASLLLSAASRALSPSRSSQVELQGRNVSVRQPVAPRDMVYGTVRKGGVIVYWEQYGPKKQYAHLVIVLAGHSVETIGAIYFDGVEAVSASGSSLGRWEGYVDLIEKAYGTQTTNPFPNLAAQVSDWGPDHVLQGCAAIAIRLNLDQNAFPNGIPAISFDIQGKNDILDPRTGLRGFTNNPALCVADYMAMPEKLGGMGAEIGADGGIDSATLIESANICDETVGDESRYSADGVVTLEGSARRAIIQSLLTSMAGSAVYRGSKWYILAGAYRAPDISIGPDDFDEKSFDLQTRRPMRDNFNAVRGQFISPLNDWQPDDFPAYKSAVYIAEDNGVEKWLDITLPFTKSAIMAQRLAKIALEKQRRQMSVSFSGKLPLFKATAGDTVAFNFPVFGIEDKPFEVESVSFSGDGENGARLELVLRETSPLVYDWDATEAQIYAAAPRTNLPSAFDIEPPFNLQAAETLYAASNGGGAKTRVNLTWSESPSINSSEYQAQFKLIDELEWRPAGLTTELAVELDDFANGEYQFRVRARSRLGVVSAYVEITKLIFGLTIPPVALENVTLQTAGGLAVIKWKQSLDIDVINGGSVVIRHSISDPPTWQNSRSMDEVAGNGSIAVVTLNTGTYLVRPRDSSGNLGPVAALLTNGAQALAFSPIDAIFADPVFSGNKDNVQIIDNTLSLYSGEFIDDWDDFDEIQNFDFSGPAVSSGVYTFAAGIDFGIISRARLRSEIRFIVANILELWDSRNGDIDEWQDIDAVSGSECDVIIEVRSTDDDPTDSPIWSDWGRLDSNEIEVRAVQARAILSTVDHAFVPIVDILRVYADEVA